MISRVQEKDLVELETTVEPTWPKLVEPLEKIIDRLSVVWGIVNHLNAVKDSPELRSAIEEVQVCVIFSAHKGNKDAVFNVVELPSKLFCLQPGKVEFQLRLGQSKPIYNAFRTIRESSDWESLSDARKRIVEG